MQDIWDFVEEENEKQQQDFSITEDQKVAVIMNAVEAEYVCNLYKKKTLEIAKAEDHIKAFIEDMDQKVEAYRRKVIEPLIQQKEFYESKLRTFGETEIAGTKKRSVKLAAGTLQFTKASDKYEHDDAKILEFINGLPKKHHLNSFLKPQPDKLDWASLKKASEVREVVGADGEKTNRLFFEDTEIPAVTVKTNLPATFSVK